jgi:hypothetical protein
MAVAGASPKLRRFTLLLFLIAVVAAVVLVVGHKSAEEPGNAVTRTAEARISRSEHFVVASAARNVSEPPSADSAIQRAGPPDPVAERTAADSAVRAAEAAADLAGAVAAPTH